MSKIKTTDKRKHKLALAIGTKACREFKKSSK